MRAIRKHRVAVCALVLAATAGCRLAAQNLVPNPSYEVMDESCIGGAWYSILADWDQVDCSGSVR